MGLLIRLLRATLGLCALLLVLAALYVSLGRELVPLVAEYRDEVQVRAQAAVGMPLSIGHLEGGWSGFDPILTAHDVQLVDAPLSGGPARAGEGDLLIVVGAEPAALERGELRGWSFTFRPRPGGDVWEDGKLTESMGVDLFSKRKPHWSHSVNAYYNGDFGKWNINFNGDFYNKVSQSTQTAINDGQLDAESESKVRSNLYAAKLVVSGPLWKGRLSVRKRTVMIGKTEKPRLLNCGFFDRLRDRVKD